MQQGHRHSCPDGTCRNSPEGNTIMSAILNQATVRQPNVQTKNGSQVTKRKGKPRVLKHNWKPHQKSAHATYVTEFAKTEPVLAQNFTKRGRGAGAGGMGERDKKSSTSIGAKVGRRLNLSGEVAALLERHASERTLDLLVGGGAAHPEHLVRVPPLRRSTRCRRCGGGVALLRLERPEPRPRHGRPSYFSAG
jgi:hypothetical protein